MPLLFLLAGWVGKAGSGSLHTFLLNLSSISTFERGINNIKIKNLQKIAIALEVENEDILNCKF